MKRLSWKYIAGLVDGEGCIDMQLTHHKQYPGRPYITPRIRVTMAECGIDPLKLLYANHGGGLSEAKRNKKNPNWQNAWSWVLGGKSARPFLQNIVNHLIIKKEQARLVIWMIDNVMGKHVNDELREHLHNELKAMKRDPHRLSEVAVIKCKELIELGAIKEYPKCNVCGKDMRPHTTRSSHIACGGKLRTLDD